MVGGWENIEGIFSRGRWEMYAGRVIEEDALGKGQRSSAVLGMCVCMLEVWIGLERRMGGQELGGDSVHSN